MDRYPWLVEITYVQESKLIGNEFKNILIEKNYIKAKKVYSGNPQANDTTEIKNEVLGNILC